MFVLFAVLASIVNAIYYICNQNVRLNTSVFMLYRGIIVSLMVIPFLFFYQTITAWQFYAIAIMQGCITAYSDFATLKANHTYGAETVSSIIPINVATTFLLWFLIEPAVIYVYLKSPIKSVFIILSMFGIIYALMRYRKFKITSNAFLYLLPVILLGSVISVCNKTILVYAEESLYGLCFWRIFVSSLTVGLIHLIIYFAKKMPFEDLYSKSNLLQTWFFIFMPMSMLFRNMAMFYAINPAYVSSIVQTSLLWIMFFNRYVKFIKFKRVYMQMDKKWAFLMLFSVVVLILATSN